MPIAIKVVIVVAFEPDQGPVPGELRYFRERENLNQTLPFPAGYRPLHLSASGILGIVTGVGAARAAASIMALGLDPRFDLTQALWLITGVAGIDPARGSLASVILPEYVVDGSLTHELDAREIPPEWPDGFVPIGKSYPYEQPREPRFNGDDGICFHLNRKLIESAFQLLRDEPLLDTENMASRRKHFQPANPAHCPPQIQRGDELACTTFWHGKLLSERARHWVEYQSDSQAVYTITAMEDAGILQALTNLAGAGRVNLNHVLIARAASNFDQQAEHVTAAESLVQSKVASYSAYLPALENAWRCGHKLIEAWLKGTLK